MAKFLLLHIQKIDVHQFGDVAFLDTLVTYRLPQWALLLVASSVRGYEYLFVVSVRYLVTALKLASKLSSYPSS